MSIQPQLFPICQNWDINQHYVLSKNWYPPPTDWIKLNVDASLMQPNLASIAAYGKKLFQWDISLLELIAVFYFKNVIQDWIIDKKRIIIEGDNVNIIKLPWNSIMKTKDLNKNIHRLHFSFLEVFKNVIFHCVSRENNRVADFCSHQALLGDFIWDVFVEDVLPSSFVDLIRKECDSLPIT
ncbi:hypothetical protein IEQ34_005516 [Dendrobium chrysotoxum]|uniref:RNase H type-1 domain-containing protein n=1 Tax=Dendrobium chrysotoxum TaxID=161865 RepID=A0AAV7HCW8_DENCH|nr:hypothetical protein IEQ34_005516 [Dendrobium chrysotoxum]